MLRSYLITSQDELKDHQDRWEVLRKECDGTIFASNYLTRAWFDVYGHIASPRIIMVEDGGDLVGVAPLAAYTYQLGRLPVKVLALAGEMKGRLRLSTTSPLYMPGRSDVLDRMIDEIRRQDWNLLTTVNLRSGPGNNDYIDSVKCNWRSEDFPSGRMLTLRLPESGSLSDTLSTKTRKNLRYRSKQLEKDGRKVECRRLSAEDIGRAVDEYARMHIKRWAHRGGSYFRDPDNVRFLKLSTAASYRAGIGHVFELLIDGKIAAQDFDILDGRTSYADKTSMSDEFLRYSPGWMVMIHSTDRMRDLGAERCMMGIGGEDYKYEMGGVEEPLIGVRATRGMVSVLSRISGSTMVQRIGSWLGYSEDNIEVSMQGQNECGSGVDAPPAAQALTVIERRETPGRAEDERTRRPSPAQTE